MNIKFELQRQTLNAVDDAGGRWLFEGGRVLRDGTEVGRYASTFRVVLGGTDALNRAMLTTTIFGTQLQDNLTVQAAHDFNSGNQHGSVSAASGQFERLIGHRFTRTQNTVNID